MTFASIRFWRVFVLGMMSALLVLACAPTQATPDSQAVPSPTVDAAEDAPPAGQGYPAPGEGDGLAEGYPAPTPLAPAEPRPSDALPTPSSDEVGTVAGTLARTTPSGVVPLQYGQLYIAEVLYDNQGQRQAAAYTNEAPTVTTDGAGHFAFMDLPPGEYALFYWTPESAVLLPDLSTEETLIINLEGGDVIDLGLLAYDF